MRTLAACLTAAATLLAVPSITATPAQADVYVAPPYYHVYPRPFRPWLPAAVYAAPATVHVGPHCATRTVRTWVNGHYVVRRVRTCY